MGGLSPSHWIIVGVIALLVFGPKKLPDLGKSLGRALREFNKARDDFLESVNSAIEPDSDPAPTRSSVSALDSTPAAADAPPLAAWEEDGGLPYGTDIHVAPDRGTLSGAAHPRPAPLEGRPGEQLHPAGSNGVSPTAAEPAGFKEGAARCEGSA